MTARVGRTLGRTIYRQVGPDRSHDDVFLGVAVSKAVATWAVTALNGLPLPELVVGPWFAAGRLVYAPPAVDVLTDWVIAMDSTELAAEVVAAVNSVMARSSV